MSATTSTASPTTYNNVVGAFVNIWPYEGGSITLSSANAGLRSVTTSKNLRQPYGEFQIELSPGGPSGTSAPSWTEILTPYSWCSIGFVRGGVANIVMAGLIISATESQRWTPQGVMRVTTVTGADVGWIFAKNFYYTLAYLSGAPASLLSGSGLLSILSAGTTGGTPASIAESFYSAVMAAPTANAAAGTPEGVLSKTKFTIGGNSYSFADVLGVQFQEFNAAIDIPTAMSSLSEGNTWYTKFQQLFEAPFYEFFINTAPSGTYDTSGGIDLPGIPAQFPATAVSVVARISPIPYLVNSGTADNPQWSMNLAIWDALANTTVEGFMSSDVTFSEEGVRNFYTLQTLTIGTLFGASNGNISPFIAGQSLLTEEARIERFGYIPCIHESQWFFDPSGIYAQQLAANGTAPLMAAVCADLLNRVASYYGPASLMGSATVTIPCAPGVLIGTRFTYMPFKNSVSWTGYVEQVSHSYQFGGSMTTTLVLSRMLPSTIYTNGSGDSLLTAIHTGMCIKQAGTYTTAVAGSQVGLTPITLQNVASGDAFSTPQGGQQPS